jgi:hypothetical protein
MLGIPPPRLGANLKDGMPGFPPWLLERVKSLKEGNMIRWLDAGIGFDALILFESVESLP